MSNSSGEPNGRDAFVAESKLFRLDIRGREVKAAIAMVGLVALAAIGGWAGPRFLGRSESAEALQLIRDRLPRSKEEHEAILAELRVQSYILSECLRTPPRDCPRLKPPLEIQSRLAEPVAPF